MRGRPDSSNPAPDDSTSATALITATSTPSDAAAVAKSVSLNPIEGLRHWRNRKLRSGTLLLGEASRSAFVGKSGDPAHTGLAGGIITRASVPSSIDHGCCELQVDLGCGSLAFKPRQNIKSGTTRHVAATENHLLAKRAYDARALGYNAMASMRLCNSYRHLCCHKGALK